MTVQNHQQSSVWIVRELLPVFALEGHSNICSGDELTRETKLELNSSTLKGYLITVFIRRMKFSTVYTESQILNTVPCNSLITVWIVNWTDESAWHSFKYSWRPDTKEVLGKRDDIAGWEFGSSQRMEPSTPTEFGDMQNIVDYRFHVLFQLTKLAGTYAWTGRDGSFHLIVVFALYYQILHSLNTSPLLTSNHLWFNRQFIRGEFYITSTTSEI